MEKRIVENQTRRDLPQPDLRRALKWLSRIGVSTLIIAGISIPLIPETASANGNPPVGFTCPKVDGTIYLPGNVRSIVGKDGICKPPVVVPIP